jgi:hypothetical protein
LKVPSRTDGEIAKHGLDGTTALILALEIQIDLDEFREETEGGLRQSRTSFSPKAMEETMPVGPAPMAEPKTALAWISLFEILRVSIYDIYTAPPPIPEPFRRLVELMTQSEMPISVKLG